MLKIGYLLLLLGGLCTGCYPSYRPCPCTHQEVRKRIYNQVLTELIERHFYSAYLPQVPVMDYQPRPQDSTSHAVVWYEQQLAIAQNHLFNDTARFKTLYLDTTSCQRFAGTMDSLTKGLCRKLMRQAGLVPRQLPAALDSLCTLQHDMAPADFQLCTASIRLAGLHHQTTDSLYMGIIRLSNVVVDSQRGLAMLTFDYIADPLSGFSGVVLAARTGQDWRINRMATLGIY